MQNPLQFGRKPPLACLIRAIVRKRTLSSMRSQGSLLHSPARGAKEVFRYLPITDSAMAEAVMTRRRSGNPNDDFPEMCTSCHVPISSLRLRKTEHCVDHRLDGVRCDGAVHRFEHLC